MALNIPNFPLNLMTKCKNLPEPYHLPNIFLKKNFTFVVDLAVTVEISFSNPLVDLLVGELLAQISHDVAELSGRDESVAVLVEDAEGLADLLLTVRVLHLARHHCEKLRKVDSAVAVGVHFVYLESEREKQVRS